ncbi:DUF3349 domain-containing protein [Xylanimonas protaetiae]|uniref:DUF3349 domain-containing protein n=2 Tax=Xylanimonas protaetiae TaxID=2509457 RepID=A0A4P6F9U1_9MICO|nr:DUF3349 domain-containing protein [Xylanimonas protaetiae]
MQRILGWLRGGYNEGVPHQDYIPLLEVLHRRLSDAEVDAVVGTLIEDEPEPLSRSAIIDAMKRRVLERPTEEDVARVVARLASAGFAVGDDGDDPSGRFAVREDF